MLPVRLCTSAFEFFFPVLVRPLAIATTLAEFARQLKVRVHVDECRGRGPSLGPLCSAPDSDESSRSCYLCWTQIVEAREASSLEDELAGPTCMSCRVAGPESDVPDICCDPEGSTGKHGSHLCSSAIVADMTRHPPRSGPSRGGANRWAWHRRQIREDGALVGWGRRASPRGSSLARDDPAPHLLGSPSPPILCLTD